MALVPTAVCCRDSANVSEYVPDVMLNVKVLFVASDDTVTTM